MQPLFPKSFFIVSFLLSTLVLSCPSLVSAGCGCKKAPPVPAQIRPHATYSGMDVTIFDPQLQDWSVYDVTFTSGSYSPGIRTFAFVTWRSSTYYFAHHPPRSGLVQLITVLRISSDWPVT